MQLLDPSFPSSLVLKMRALLTIIPGTPAPPAEVCVISLIISHIWWVHTHCAKSCTCCISETPHRWTFEVGALTIHVYR